MESLFLALANECHNLDGQEIGRSKNHLIVSLSIVNHLQQMVRLGGVRRETADPTTIRGRTRVMKTKKDHVHLFIKRENEMKV